MPHGLSSSKAKEILKHGKVRGHKLTKKQKGYMGAVAGGTSLKHGSDYKGEGCTFDEASNMEGGKWNKTPTK